MRQIFEYTFGKWNPALRWWKAPESGKIQDPFRRIVLYDDLDQAEADFESHKKCSRRVLEQAEVLILTLGLTEIWEDTIDGSVICLPSGPYVNEGGDMTRYRFRVSRYAENLANLERIYSLMAEHNPGCRIIVTVSPVHLWATFREDSDVISASCNSKSTLRAVADEFVAGVPECLLFPGIRDCHNIPADDGAIHFHRRKRKFPRQPRDGRTYHEILLPILLLKIKFCELSRVFFQSVTHASLKCALILTS